MLELWTNMQVRVATMRILLVGLSSMERGWCSGGALVTELRVVW
jgi:hypothetical protein